MLHLFRRSLAKKSPRWNRTIQLRVEELETRAMLHGDAGGGADSEPLVPLTGDMLRIIGTDGHDAIRAQLVGAENDHLFVTMNGQTLGEYHVDDISQIFVSGRGGNDSIQLDPEVSIPALISGGGGEDLIVGTASADLIRGDGGNDTIMAGVGDDMIEGRGGNDAIDGGIDADTLAGNRGADFLFGGGNRVEQTQTVGDRLIGGPGVDNFGVSDSADVLADFGTSDIAFEISNTLVSQPHLLGIRAFELPGAPDIFTQATGFAHTPSQTDEVDYSAYTNPPTYGPHHDFLNGQVPIPTGVHATEDSAEIDENLVHNLEHGHIWISYNPDEVDGGELLQMQDFVRSFGAEAGVVLTPRAANDVPIVIASWGHFREFNNFDATAFRNFIFTNRGYDHEGFITP